MGQMRHTCPVTATMSTRKESEMTTEAVTQEYQTVSLSQLTESPTNPRKTFDAQTLKELADSILAVGLLQPILVRPTAHEGSFEIVAGARRYRAAQLAGMEAVAVRVCQLTDAQALEAQVIENLIRADVHPYEETQGFLALMRLDPARYTAQELAAKTGKSVTFVVARLKLADLIPAAAKSLQKDEIAIGHALLLARLTPEQQKEALPHCFEDVWNGGKQTKRLTTVPQFNRFIEQNIILELSEAPFSREDATLYPEAGACLYCPKRSGFNALLFPDVKQDSCFDAACYGEKVTRFIATSNLVQLAGDYRPVPEGSPAVPRSNYTIVKPGDHCSYATKGIVAIGNNPGAILTVCTSLECAKHTTRSHAASSGDHQDSDGLGQIEAIRKQRRIEEKVKEATAAQLRKDFTKKLSAVPTADEMELLAFMVAHAVEDYADEFLTSWGVTPPDEEAHMTSGDAVDQLLAHLAGLTGKQRTAAIFEMLLFSAGGCDSYNYQQSPTVAKAAKLYRVNVETVEKRIRRKVEAEIEAEEAQQVEEVATKAAEAEEQPTETTEAAQDDEDEPDEDDAPPEPPKARSREGKGSGDTKVAVATLPATAKKRTGKA